MSPTPRYQWAPLEIDERDNSGPQHDPDTIVGTKGRVVAGITLHLPGVTLRATVYSELHDQIAGAISRGADLGGKRLCGVEHVEDIQPWQTPHSARAMVQHAIRNAERQHRRPVVIVHGWQHIGPCPPQEGT